MTPDDWTVGDWLALWTVLHGSKAPGMRGFAAWAKAGLERARREQPVDNSVPNPGVPVDSYTGVFPEVNPGMMGAMGGMLREARQQLNEPPESVLGRSGLNRGSDRTPTEQPGGDWL